MPDVPGDTPPMTATEVRHRAEQTAMTLDLARPGSDRTFIHMGRQITDAEEQYRIMRDNPGMLYGEPRRNRLDIEIECRDRPDRMEAEMTINWQGQRIGLAVRTEELHNEDYRRHLIRAATQALAERIVAPVIEQEMERAFRHRREGIYGNARAEMWHRMRDYMGHGVDMARGAVTRKVERSDKPIQCLAGMPKHFEDGPIRAVMIDTTEMIYQEAQKLGHCLYNSYTQCIIEHNYVAYHISLPGSKHGLTLGFKRVGRTWDYDQLKGKANTTKHNNKPGVASIVAQIGNALNRSNADVRHGEQV